MHEATLLLSRAQFALTAIFHILWPILTISLSAFILVMEALWIRKWSTTITCATGASCWC